MGSGCPPPMETHQDSCQSQVFFLSPKCSCNRVCVCVSRFALHVFEMVVFTSYFTHLIVQFPGGRVVCHSGHRAGVQEMCVQ